jgi:hypothetical protein
MLSRANFAPVPPVYNGNACASQVPYYRSLPSPHLHRTNSTGCGHVSLPESTLQSKHEILQVNPMFVRKPHFAQNVVGIQILPVMPRAQRNCGKVRRLLAHSPGAQDVRVGRFDNGRPAAHSGTDYAWKRPHPSQVIWASVRTSPQAESFLADRHCSFRRQATLQRRTPA